VGHDNILGLTVKYPEPGSVKTRLAKDIGDGAACRIYRSMAEKIIADTGTDAGGYERMIFYSPAAAERKVRVWLPGEIIVPQRGADIGGIMDSAFCDMFEGGAGKAVVAGVDIPGLDKHIVNLAFQELDGADVVIGPSTDGGYYLIGLKSPLPHIFQGMPWGTAKVYGETVRAVGHLGLTIRTVRAMTDVDTLGDLLKVKELYPDCFRGM
jgi:uncharacterized protein